MRKIFLLKNLEWCRIETCRRSRKVHLTSLLETGCFVKRIKGMNNFLTIYLLTLFIFAGQSFALEAVANLENHPTHLRLNIHVPKDQLEIENLADGIYIKTLNVELYENIKKTIGQITFDKKYVSEVVYNDTKDRKDSVSSIKFQLAQKDIELFSFYQDKEAKYILDFWKNTEDADLKKPALTQKKDITPENIPVTNKSPVEPEAIKPLPLPEKKLVLNQSTTKEPPKATLFNFEKDYRDFRYGAPFIWDYQPLLPTLPEGIDVEHKTAEFFYPIKDRDFEKSPLETHLQLNINLYRQKKWGLMNKSIELFNKKYPAVANQFVDLHEYMKANALLMSNIQSKDPSLEKMAINMYKTISGRTDIYPFKKALYQFLISYHTYKDEAVLGLQAAKKYYVLTLENFDREDSITAAESILYFLSKLNQIDTLKSFIEEKTTLKILPPQIMLAYKLYTTLKMGNYKEVIKIYEKEQKSLVKPVHPVILYNVAEAYFRNADYDKAVTMYDNFLAIYSHYHVSGHARLRIAVCYELLEKNIDETAELYKNAVNRASDIEILYEAKIRYVALRSVRKKVLNADDQEIRVFLEKSENDRYVYSHDLNKLLWLVRLRTFIVDGRFQEALSYLNAIPITSMSLGELRMFEGDGAEIVYGILFELYRESEYSKIVKIWEIYKDKYISKVAMDPFLNFIVGSSYIRLGLFKGFERLYVSFEKIKNSPEKTFPVWNERIHTIDSKLMLLELKVISNFELQNYTEVKKYLVEYERVAPETTKLNYYKGMMYFKLKDYKLAAKNLEEYLSNKGESNVYDASEVAQMLRAYADSLYELNLLEKFQKVAKAILTDTNNYASGNMFMVELRERITYLMVEMLNADGKKIKELGESIEQFKKNFKESIYLSRINYLHAMSLIKTNKESEALQLLEALIKDEKASDYIKELAKSELSLIKIKNRTL